MYKVLLCRQYLSNNWLTFLWEMMTMRKYYHKQRPDDFKMHFGVFRHGSIYNRWCGMSCPDLPKYTFNEPVSLWRFYYNLLAKEFLDPKWTRAKIKQSIFDRLQSSPTQHACTGEDNHSPCQSLLWHCKYCCCYYVCVCECVRWNRFAQEKRTMIES